ncbi:MAG: hypothetical protein P4L71_08345 [Acetobacteraceae bacterium]|nr:hypothetical protein [Acetobacteraceae bacterium]
MKTEVLAAIGEGELQRPAAVNAALAANDRVKYAFTLLQMAATHADRPEQPAASLKRERIACGIDDEALDSMAAAARRKRGHYQIPGAARLLARIAADIRVMAAPVLAANQAGFAARLDTLLAAIPSAEGDVLEGDALTAMTRANPAAGTDSLHRLVMDMHKELNALQAALAEETIDGAAAYGLEEVDRPRVAAFMAGLNRTARLKFDHPGLATTATRTGTRLIIQNDIGTTDAHVIVVHVEDESVTVTYTDVHPERLTFFQTLLSSHPVAWETTQSGQLGAGAPFYMATGRLDAANEPACQAYLALLGSRLVFLIDWNRARRQLRAFLPGEPRVALLRWAAEQDIGHRGFLALGGAKLVNQAIEATAGSAMHFGDRLSDVLGVVETETFLRFVLRASTDCMLSRRSPSLLRDRIRAELARHFSNEERRLLQLASDHAGLVFELACLVRDGALAVGETAVLKHQKRAARFEHDADRLVSDVREAVRKRPDYAAFAPLMHASDDAADELEEAVFLLAQFGEDHPPAPIIEKLQALAALVVETAQEWVKALLDAAHAEDRSAAEDADDFLVAIDRVLALEHAADDAERALTAASVRHAADFRQLHLCASLGNKLEEAADALKRASLILRDRVLGEVLGG